MSLLAENTKRWRKAKFDPSKQAAARSVARKLVAAEAKARYEGIADRIAKMGHNIPWWVIAVIHDRECLKQRDGSLSWSCNIAQGSPFSVRSKIIPRNGPFRSFEDAAVDALVVQAPRAALNTDWSAGGVMTILERYNGLGYAKKGRPSPYIWSGTDQYVKGKYVRDGVYDPNVVDAQLGVAIVLSEMQKLDHTIVFDGDAPKQTKVSRKKEVTTAGGIMLAAGTGARTAADAGNHWAIIAAILVVGVVLAGIAIWKISKKKKSEVENNERDYR